MPPKLSARQLFWTGVVLTAAGAAVGPYLATAVYTVWGPDAINSEPFLAIMGMLWPVLVPLGVVVLACSVIARAIESQSYSTSGTHGRGRMPPRLTARQIFWSGLILAIVGSIVMAMTTNLFMDLSGRSDLSANLLRDLWSFLGLPVTEVAVPLGIALVPCAFIVRMLESRESVPHEVSAEEFNHP
jgi:hypothetical protein